MTCTDRNRTETSSASVLVLIAALMAALTAAMAMAGCSPQSRTRTVDVLWPDVNDPYQKVSQQWTRRAVIYNGIDVEFTATATIKSMDWRKAYAKRHAEMYASSPPELEDMLKDQERAHARDLEIVLSLSSPKPELAKLAFKDPKWRVFLKSGQDRTYPLEVAPMEKDRWPETRLAAFFPYWKRWQKFYTLRFAPRDQGPLALVLAGPAGTVELSWEDFN